MAQIYNNGAEAPDHGLDRDVLAPFVRDTLLRLEDTLRMELDVRGWGPVEDDLTALIDVVLAHHAVLVDTVLSSNFIPTLELVVATRRDILLDLGEAWITSEVKRCDKLLERFREILVPVRAVDGATQGV